MTAKLFTIDTYSGSIAKGLGSTAAHGNRNRVYVGGVFASKSGFAKAVSARPLGHSAYSASKDAVSPRDTGQLPVTGVLYVRLADRDAPWVRLSEVEGLDPASYGENL